MAVCVVKAKPRKSFELLRSKSPFVLRKSVDYLQIRMSDSSHLFMLARGIVSNSESMWVDSDPRFKIQFEDFHMSGRLKVCNLVDLQGNKLVRINHRVGDAVNGLNAFDEIHFTGTFFMLYGDEILYFL